MSNTAFTVIGFLIIFLATTLGAAMCSIGQNEHVVSLLCPYDDA